MNIFHHYRAPGHKKNYLLLGLCWLLLQIFLYAHFGIVTGYESAKYIEQANQLLATGHYTSGNFLFYSVEILLIALSKITGLFPWLAVIIQMLVNAVALACFYQLAVGFTQSASRALLLTFFFLGMFYYHLYNVHLFTESLYFSFSLIYTYFLFSLKRLSLRNFILLFLGLSLLYVTRPTGLFFIPATLVFILVKFFREKALLLLSLSALAGVVLLYLLINFALKSGGEFDFLLPYLKNQVICGVSTIQGLNNIRVPVEKNSVEGLWYIISHHTTLFLDLAGRRLAAFWGVRRSYYSLGHNLFLCFYFYGSYLLILAGLKKLVRNYLPEMSFFFCNIILVTITVALSCDEWSNRFILALLPFFLLPASVGLTKPKPVRNFQ
ncbi:MAG: hypothetical protein ACXVBP_02240 [Flavisolibacter sp.]